MYFIMSHCTTLPWSEVLSELTSRHISRIWSLVTQSLSLNSYLTFHPSDLNLFLSIMMEWNHESAKRSFLYFPFSEGNLTWLNLSSGILLKILDILAFNPFEGSVVTLKEFWRIEIGNRGWGLVDMNKRKFSLTKFFSNSNYSSIFSSSFKKLKERWQFVR